MAKLNAGIIGAGNRTRQLVQFINMMEDFNVTALADVSDERIEYIEGLLEGKQKVFNDYNDLLSIRDLDAVFIVSHNSSHADITVNALEAGIPVYLEKPMATTVKDCDRIISAAERTKIPLMVGLQLRYSELFTKVMDIINSGDIGNIRMMWCKEIRAPFNPGWEEWRLSEERSGGSLVEKNCHHFDLFNWFSNSKPVKVSAFGGRDSVYKNREILDNALVITEYKNCVRSSLDLALFCPKSCKPGLEIGCVGEKGIIQSYYNEGKIELRSDKRKDQITTYTINPKYKGLGHGGAEYDALLAFAESIKRGRSPVTDAKTGKESIMVSIAAEKAVQEDRVVYIDELESE